MGKFPDLLFLQLSLPPTAFVAASLRELMASVQPVRHARNVHSSKHEVQY